MCYEPCPPTCGWSIVLQWHESGTCTEQYVKSCLPAPLVHDCWQLLIIYCFLNPLIDPYCWTHEAVSSTGWFVLITSTLSKWHSFTLEAWLFSLNLLICHAIYALRLLGYHFGFLILSMLMDLYMMMNSQICYLNLPQRCPCGSSPPPMNLFEP